ncbi:MAG: M20/M25/M40 family metallo-hydrolase [Pyrinomonadaceae bacterium]
MLRRFCAIALLVCFSLLPTLALTAQQPAARVPQNPETQITPAVKPPKPSAPEVAQAAAAQTAPANDVIARIKNEGMNHSQVMQTLSYLSDVIGPRLTASRNMKRANEWTRDKMAEWGLQNAHLEAWGPFGRGWTLKNFSAQVTEPQDIPLIAYPKAWSPGTNGMLTGDVVYVDAKNEAELQKFKGKLKGAIVLTGAMREVKAHFEALGSRLSEKELLELADAPAPSPRQNRRLLPDSPQFREFVNNAKFNALKSQFFADEGAALLVDASRGGDGGTMFVQSASVPQKLDTSSDAATVRSLFQPRVNPWDKNAPAIIPQMVLAVEQYNRLARMIQAGEKLRMSVNLEVQFQDADLMGYNTVAEITGTDKKDELVMLGGHMDSWHAGTGATDNGAGVAVAMEAVRILKALNLQPRRTIRVGLWSGEEQGLFGSRAYVAEHFGALTDSSPEANFTALPGGTAASPPQLNKKPDYEKLSAYYNLDNGTGKIRGVYLQGNEAVRTLFREWLAPFREMGAQTLSISNTGGTDHLSFDGIGLPGFQFIQDEIEYDTRTHHSNQDVFDRIQADDLKQAATIMAAFVYNTAMRDERLPRKTAPAR